MEMNRRSQKKSKNWKAKKSLETETTEMTEKNEKVGSGEEGPSLLTSVKHRNPTRT